MADVTNSSSSTTTTMTSNSIFDTASSLIVLVWFEIIAACIASVLRFFFIFFFSYSLLLFSYGLGFLGNVLSLIVFYCHKEFRKVSTGVLFILITLSNFFHLGALAVEFLTIYNVTVFENVLFQCQLTYFVQNVSRAMSTYFMVTVSMDRFIRSELPMRSKMLCTRRNVAILTCIYLGIFGLFWSFFLYPFIAQNPLTGACNYRLSDSYFYFVMNLHVPIRAVFICFIPVLIMLGANIRMLMNIRHSRNRVTDGPTAPTSNTNLPVSSNRNSQRRRPRRMSAIDRMLYYMMAANASIFIITQIPFHLYSCIRNNLIGLDATRAQLIRAMLLIWSSLYFGIAFYFYCLTSPLFRQKFLRIIRRIFCCQNIIQPRMATATVVD